MENKKEENFDLKMDNCKGVFVDESLIGSAEFKNTKDLKIKKSIVSRENDIRKKWYKNPNIIVPAIIGLIGAAATIIAAWLR
jgi:hypothetical protein